MQQYQSFVFDSYSLDQKSGEVALKYSLDDAMHFTEKIQLPASTKSVDPEILDRALFALHLIGGVSYYKTCVPKKIEVRSGSLTKEQAHFFHEVYEKGLGEFFFRNDIDFRGLIQFPIDGKSSKMNEQRANEQTSKRVLVPLGGGKDSIVTAELLKKAGYDVTLLRMTGHPIIDETVEALGLPCIVINRTLDPQLFELNTQGALNGHVPITAYLTFVSLIVAMLHDFDAVVLSNERSANIGNVSFKGMVINHQWSKSLEFETMMQEYIRNSIGSGIEVFSLLRPWSELKIVEEFMKHPKYQDIATSCNKNWTLTPHPPAPARSGGHRGQKTKWCGSCPKCAFVFALYAAFISPEKLETIFGKNLYADQSLLPLYRELLGLERYKPFECVGTPEETAAAFLLARERGLFSSSPAMIMFEKESLPSIRNPELLIRETLEPSSEHAMPEEFSSILSS